MRRERPRRPCLVISDAPTDAPVSDATGAVPAPAKLPAECGPSVLLQFTPHGAEEPPSGAQPTHGLERND